MKWTVLGLILVGIVAAGAAAMLAVALQARGGGGGGGGSDPGNEPVAILVATRNLPAMSVVGADAVSKMTVRRAEMPEKAMTNNVQVVGQILMSDVLKDQVFTEKQFANAESGMNVSTALKAGERAMGVMLSSETGIEDLLYPGCAVDVVATLRLPSQNESNNFGEFVSSTILQNIQVLQVGRRTIVDKEGSTATSTDSKRGRMVTLKVDAEQAQMLQMAATQGTVSVSLRNPLDTDTPNITTTRLNDLNEEIDERIRAINQPKPEAQPMSVPTVSGTIDPAAATQPAAVVTVTDTPKPVAVSPEMWTVTIMRNKLIEKQNFPMPPEKQGRRNR